MNKTDVIKCDRVNPQGTDYCAFLCPYLEECVREEMDKVKEAIALQGVVKGLAFIPFLADNR